MLSTYKITKKFTDGALKGLTIEDELKRCSRQPFVVGQLVAGMGSSFKVIAVSVINSQRGVAYDQNGTKRIVSVPVK